MRKASIVVVLALALALSARANTVVSRDDWVAAMRTGLPVALCKSGSYFRACFEVSAEQCEQIALSATRTCLADLSPKIPETLVQPVDGTKWGKKVGACAGNAYEAALAEKHLGTAVCRDASAWQ